MFYTVSLEFEGFGTRQVAGTRRGGLCLVEGVLAFRSSGFPLLGFRCWRFGGLGFEIYMRSAGFRGQIGATSMCAIPFLPLTQDQSFEPLQIIEPEGLSFTACTDIKSSPIKFLLICNCKEKIRLLSIKTLLAFRGAYPQRKASLNSSILAVRSRKCCPPGPT